MDLPQPLIPGRLIRRYQRFLADVVLATGEVITAHSPNTGALLGCQTLGSPVWLWCSPSPGRKYPLTWELVAVNGGTLVGINTARSNALVREGIERGTLTELVGYGRVRSEVRYGQEGSRIDLLLERDGARCYVEVKNVTAAVEAGIALFPDAVSLRATKHLRELTAMVRAGHRAVVVFCVQRDDVTELRPADAIDPAYGQALRAAMAAGVEALAYGASVTTTAIVLTRPIPVQNSGHREVLRATLSARQQPRAHRTRGPTARGDSREGSHVDALCRCVRPAREESELTQRRNDATRIEPISAAVTAEVSVLSRELKCRALLFFL